MSSKLLNCPFCGADIHDTGCTNITNEEWHYVWCWQCRTQTGRYDSREKAIKRWNTRTTQQPMEK